MTDYKQFSGRTCCSVFKIRSDLANDLVTWVTQHHFSSTSDSYKSGKSGRKSEFTRDVDSEGVGSARQVKGLLNLEHPRGKISPPEMCQLGAKVIFNFLPLPISDSGLPRRARKSRLSLYVPSSPKSVTNAEWKLSIRAGTHSVQQNLGFTICCLTSPFSAAVERTLLCCYHKPTVNVLPPGGKRRKNTRIVTKGETEKKCHLSAGGELRNFTPHLFPQGCA